MNFKCLSYYSIAFLLISSFGISAFASVSYRDNLDKFQETLANKLERTKSDFTITPILGSDLTVVQGLALTKKHELEEFAKTFNLSFSYRENTEYWKMQLDSILIYTYSIDIMKLNENKVGYVHTHDYFCSTILTLEKEIVADGPCFAMDAELRN